MTRDSKEDKSSALKTIVIGVNKAEMLKIHLGFQQTQDTHRRPNNEIGSIGQDHPTRERITQRYPIVNGAITFVIDSNHRSLCCRLLWRLRSTQLILGDI